MIIYKTTNLINGKIYIGKDSNDDPKYLGSGKILKLAIKKYGKSNFKKVVLENCSSLDNLNEREIYWINKLNSQDKNIGYNILNGGEISPMYGNTHTDETKFKMAKNHYNCNGINNPMYGKTFKDAWVEQGLSSKEIEEKWGKWVKKRSELSKGKNNPMYGSDRSGKNNPFYNAKHSEETKKILSSKAKKKKVLQYTLNNKLIKEWESTMEVYRTLNINCRNCCRGLSKTSCGYIWKYKI